MTRAGDAVLSLLNARGAGATICPSEAARALAEPNEDWRAAMPAVHEAVDRLVAEGAVRLSWKGAALPSRAGPYRIGHGLEGRDDGR